MDLIEIIDFTGDDGDCATSTGFTFMYSLRIFVFDLLRPIRAKIRFSGILIRFSGLLGFGAASTGSVCEWFICGVSSLSDERCLYSTFSFKRSSSLPFFFINL